MTEWTDETAWCIQHLFCSLLSKWLHEWRESLLCSLEIQLIARCYEPCGFWFRSRRHVAAVVFVVVNHVIIVIVIVVIQRIHRYLFILPSFSSIIAVIHHAVVVLIIDAVPQRSGRTTAYLTSVFLPRRLSTASLFFFFSRIDRSRRHQATFLFVYRWRWFTVVHHALNRNRWLCLSLSLRICLQLLHFRQSFFPLHLIPFLFLLFLFSRFLFFLQVSVGFLLFFLVFLLFRHIYRAKKLFFFFFVFLFFVARGYPPRRFRF